MLERTARFYARGEKPQGISPMMLADGTTAEIRLYDAIDSWGEPFGVSAKEFAAVLDALPEGTAQINLHVNSPGGEAWDALAIMNSLRSHPAKVVATVDGIAASAASFIVAGADELVMMPNSELMVHDAWGMAIGNAADMAKMASDLNHLSDNIADVYAAKSGGSVEDWRATMLAETWLSAQEAVDAGLADSVAKPSKATDATAAKARFDLSIFNYAGREHAPAPQSPAAIAPGQPSKEGDATMAFLDDVRQRLGVTDAATDETAILAALDEAIKPAAPAEPVVPVDSVVVSKPKWDEMKATYDTMRDQLTNLLDEKAAERREGTVKAAITAGKIMPAEKQAYLNALEMDEEGTVKRLDTLEPGIVPVAAVGHAQDREGDPTKAPGWSDSLFPDVHPEQKVS